MKKFQVFISYKNTDETGKQVKDREMAVTLYKALCAHGLEVFFGDETLSSLGTAQYKDAIDEALDVSEILIVVGTSLQNITSSWVKYEWDSFYGDILSGKKKGQMFSYIDDILASDLPRTLRQLQVFEADKWDVEKICTYISNALGYKSEPAHTLSNTSKAKGLSVYSVLEKNESARLVNQAKLVYDNDMELLTPLISVLSSDKKINVLDIGCANGYLTKQIFGNFNDNINKVIGVDYEVKCVEKAKENAAESYKFYQIDVESNAFEEDLQQIMDDNGIDKFDLVYSTLVLHHLSDPAKVLRKLRKFVSKNGKLYLRSCDDDEICAYPDEDGLVERVLKDTYSIPGISDRIHGRKLYYELYKAGYSKITIKPYYITTADMDIDERIQFCHDMLYWRRNRYKRLVDLEPDNYDHLKKYNEFCTNYDEIEERFYDPAFYFKVAGPIAIAEK